MNAVIFWFDLIILPTLALLGIVLFVDLKKWKKTAADLREDNRRMQRIIDALPDPTMVIDHEKRVIVWNRAIEAMSGVKAGDILGKGNFEYAIPFYGKRRPIMIDLVNEWDEHVAQKYTNVERRGDILVSETMDHPPLLKRGIFRNVAGPIYDHNGNPIGAIESIHDITGHRIKLDDLKEREELLRVFVAYSPVAVAMCDRKMNYLHYSRRWITDFALPDEDLTGRNHYDVFDPLPEHWKDQDDRCLQGETIVNEEEAITRADGSVEWVRRILHPWRTHKGTIGGIIILAEVITEKKRAEQSTREMENRLQVLSDNLPGGILFQARITPDGTRQTTFISGNAEQLFGEPIDRILSDSKVLFDKIDPEDRERLFRAEAEAIEKGTVLDEVLQVHIADDGPNWHRVVAKPRQLANGDFFLDGFIIDLTEQKQAQEEIRKRRVFLESVLYHAPDAIVTLDPRHRVLDWNPGAEKIYGYRRDEALGQKLDELIGRHSTREEVEKNIKTALSGQRVEAFEGLRYRKDGQPVHVIVAGSPIMLDDTQTGAIAMYTDITALKQAEEELRRNERMLRRIMDIVPSMIFVKNAEGRFLMVNQAVADRYRMPVEELVGKLQADVHPDRDQVARYMADDRRAMDSGNALFVREEPFLDHTGATRWLEVIKLPCDIEDFGEPAVVALATDITARREAEARIQESEKRYRTVFENTGTGTVLSEADTTLSMVNREFARMVGYDRSEIEGKMSWTQLIAPEDVEQMKAYHYARRKDPLNTPTQYECHLVTRKGGVIPTLLRVRLIPGTRASIGSFLDISDRKRAEDAMVDANRMLRLVLDTIPVRVFWKDTELRYLGCNRPFAEDAGFANPKEVIGRDDFEWIPSDLATVFRKNDQAVMETGQPRLNIEKQWPSPRGERRWLQTSKVPMRDGQGKIIGVLGTYQDITERKEAVEEMRQLRNYLSNIIDSMPSVLIGVDTDGRVTQWNKQAERVTGLSFEKAHAQPLADVFPYLIDEMARIQAAIRDRQVIHDPKIPRRQRSEVRFEDVTIYPLVANGVDGAVIRVDDVTERVRLEEMMIQSEKMLSVGGLAAGMAHEINNPLAGILQNTAVLENRLLGDLPANRKAAETAGVTMAAVRQYMELRKLPNMLENIRESGDRAAAIVKNMLSFARKSDQVVSSHDLAVLLDRTIDLARTDYDMKKQYDFKQIEIIREYDPNVPEIPCESSKLQQVFLNILKNGAEAMASQRQKKRPPAFVLRVCQEDQWVRLEIEDNGPGMDELTRRRIFEPFFTTKPVGKGTGLGLSVSYFIITENHGGKMDADTADGGGTRFVIRLPKTGKS
ncbi:PAS domain S-box protein [uncultured Desulfosarcina sp.]|uniref:PAS domain-containing sensor histidine kinase n=1 Tax=uncultured Desulfosarcina sp. TaxID=218289 RepID=UPI0029C729EE|nr:PAS domain S-box protein [uncultured Desulfosarcina sp.]